MLKKIIKKYLLRLKNFFTNKELQESVSELLRIKVLENANSLNKKEHRVFSQHGEDGIINEIFKRIGTTNKQFFEFGAGNGLENNSIFLLTQGWSGIWVEGSNKNYNILCSIFKNAINNKKLIIKNEIINENNINKFVKANSINEEIDFMSIDIDGNDYYIWKALEIKPRVLCIEFNASFPPNSEFLDKISDEFWDNSLWFGASIDVMTKLAHSKGYSLVCVDSSGTNLFFLRNDVINESFEDINNIEKLYFPTRYSLYYPQGHKKNFKIQC